MITLAKLLAQSYPESSSAIIELTDCLIKKMTYISEIFLGDLFEDSF